MPDESWKKRGADDTVTSEDGGFRVNSVIVVDSDRIRQRYGIVIDAFRNTLIKRRSHSRSDSGERTRGTGIFQLSPLTTLANDKRKC